MTASNGTDRRRWWVAGSVGVLAMCLVAVWFGLSATVGRVHATNTGFEIVSDAELTLRFDLVRDPARPVTCRLYALDEGFGQVGTTTVTVEPAPTSPSRHTASVRTVSRAATGYAEGCTYADD